MPHKDAEQKSSIERIIALLNRAKTQLDRISKTPKVLNSDHDEKTRRDVPKELQDAINKIDKFIADLKNSEKDQVTLDTMRAAISFLNNDIPKIENKYLPTIAQTSSPKRGDVDKQESVLPDWLSEENQQKVIDKLTELSKKNDDLKPIIHSFYKALEAYKTSTGAEKKKAGDFLDSMIRLPGWGVVKDPLDAYTPLKAEEVKRFSEAAYNRFLEQNLQGLEKDFKPVFDAYASILAKREWQFGDDPNQELDPNKVGIMPMICIDGPPGTGKTTVAKAIAHALQMGFKDISFSGANDTAMIRGHGSNWVSPGPGLVAKAMLDSGRERTLIVINEAEKAKDDNLIKALDQILEPNQRGCQDDFFEINIDKRKCMFVLTTNQFELLPPFIQDRVIRINLKGYTDEKKIEIMRNKIENRLERTQGILFESNDPKNRKVFRSTEPKEDVVQFLVENYITEPGMREAEALIETLKNAAIAQKVSSGENVLINKNFIEKTLGQPNPTIIEIKKIDQDIIATKKILSDTSIELRKLLAKKDKKYLTEIENLLNVMVDNRNKVLLLEENMLEQLTLTQASDDKTKFSGIVPERMAEHRRDIENTKAWTFILFKKTKEFFDNISLPIPKALSLVLEEPNKVVALTPPRFTRDLKDIKETAEGAEEDERPKKQKPGQTTRRIGQAIRWKNRKTRVVSPAKIKRRDTTEYESESESESEKIDSDRPNAQDAGPSKEHEKHRLGTKGGITMTIPVSGKLDYSSLPENEIGSDEEVGSEGGYAADSDSDYDSEYDSDSELLPAARDRKGKKEKPEQTEIARRAREIGKNAKGTALSGQPYSTSSTSTSYSSSMSSTSPLFSPSFEAAALRSAKLGRKIKKYKEGASPITNEGWVKMYKEIEEKIGTEIQKGKGQKPVKHPKTYSEELLVKHNQARRELYSGWSVGPEQNEESLSFDLKYQAHEKAHAETMATVSRNIEKKQIEIVAKNQTPTDATIYHTLKICHINARLNKNIETGEDSRMHKNASLTKNNETDKDSQMDKSREIFISDCEDPVTAIKIREYGTLMGLKVIFDPSTLNSMNAYSNSTEHKAEVDTLIQKIKSQAALITADTDPPKRGPKFTSSSSSSS